MSDVVDDLWWRDEDSQYIRHRSDRYPGATNIEPGWTLRGRRRFATDCLRSGSEEPNRRDSDHRLLTERGFRGHGHCYWRWLRRCHGLEEQRG